MIFLAEENLAWAFLQIFNHLPKKSEFRTLSEILESFDFFEEKY